MLGYTTKKVRTMAMAALTTMMLSQAVLADNQIALKKESGTRISVELSNIDAVAGFQFSINGRGCSFGQYEASARASAAGLSVYQYLKDDSTLNVVILAPVRSALPAGEGTIGTFSFSVVGTSRDSVRVFLSKVVLSSADAQYLSVSVSQLAWELNSKSSATMQFALEQNYPNPFNPSTTITYRLDAPATVRLVVYDITGRSVETLVDKYQQVGKYSVKWNAGDHVSSRLASGMYIARLQVGDQVAVQKMVLAK